MIQYIYKLNFLLISLPEQIMKQMHLAEGMDKMIEVFIDENISEYFFYKEKDEWIEVLK